MGAPLGSCPQIPFQRGPRLEANHNLLSSESTTFTSENRSCVGPRKFGLFYPAELRITLPSGASCKFTDPAAIADFSNRALRRAASPN